MTYPAATRARRVACGVCAACESPGKPVASRGGFTHQLAGLLCVEHLLLALGMPVEPPRAEAPPLATDVRAAFRASLRVPTEHDAAPSAVTAARQAPPAPLEPEALAAALLAMRELGAVPLRSEPTYGEPCGWGCPWKPSKTAREHDTGRAVAWDDEVTTGLAGQPVGLDDEAVPSGARKLARAALKAGWRAGVMAGPGTVILRCEDAGLGVLIVCRYERGRYAAGWLRGGSRGEPAPCTVKQVTAILKAST